MGGGSRRPGVELPLQSVSPPSILHGYQHSLYPSTYACVVFAKLCGAPFCPSLHCIHYSTISRFEENRRSCDGRRNHPPGHRQRDQRGVSRPIRPRCSRTRSAHHLRPDPSQGRGQRASCQRRRHSRTSGSPVEIKCLSKTQRKSTSSAQSSRSIRQLMRSPALTTHTRPTKSLPRASSQ